MPFFSVRQSWDGSILSILRVQWTPDIFAGNQPTEEVIRLTVAGGTGLVNDVFALWAPRDTPPTIPAWALGTIVTYAGWARRRKTSDGAKRGNRVCTVSLLFHSATFGALARPSTSGQSKLYLQM